MQVSDFMKENKEHILELQRMQSVSGSVYFNTGISPTKSLNLKKKMSITDLGHKMRQLNECKKVQVEQLVSRGHSAESDGTASPSPEKGEEKSP
jgi:hypothetical protein